MGRKIIDKTISISMMREDVVKVTCINEKATNRDFMWKAIGESKELNVTHRSGHAHVLTIKGTSIKATRSQFVCRLKDDKNKGNSRGCCTVIAKHKSTFNSNGTLFQNASSIAYSSFRTATISATVSATAVLLFSVGAAVIIALKRKRLSDKYIASDSSDNLAYLLDLKEQQVWNGSEIIPIDCLLIGKSLGERNIDNRLENCKTDAISYRRRTIWHGDRRKVKNCV